MCEFRIDRYIINLNSQTPRKYISQPLKEKCMSEVVRIGSAIIFI